MLYFLTILLYFSMMVSKMEVSTETSAYIT